MIATCRHKNRALPNGTRYARISHQPWAIISLKCWEQHSFCNNHHCTQHIRLWKSCKQNVFFEENVKSRGVTPLKMNVSTLIIHKAIQLMHCSLYSLSDGTLNGARAKDHNPLGTQRTVSMIFEKE